MSNLVTIISKFYDASGKVCPNLQVKSRYKGSTRENSKKTNDDGLFVFQASPNRIVEILAKLPSLKKYQVFKIINTSIQSSLNSPIIINLPKQGLVTTVFKVVDSQGKEMANFPVQTRPKGGRKFDRLTDNKGFLEVQSSPNREIEFLVLNVTDDFIIKKSLNSMIGTQEPILIKLEEPYKNFISTSKIELLDRDGNDYIIEKTKVEILNINTGEKIIYSTSNGKIPVRSMVGEKLQFTVLKPDGKPLNSVFYTAKRINEKPIKLHLDVDIIKGRTVEGEPSIDKMIENTKCSDKCTVETLSFMTTPGPYVISMETWKKILEFERYESKPYHPGDSSSGVTLGIGYDLGQQSKSQIKEDLSPFYTSGQIARLLEAQGKSGYSAAALIPKLADIRISKEKALYLATALKTRYAKQVLSIYPKTLELHPHCQGVLLSLVFNRGPSLSDRKGNVTRKHMRQIKEAFESNEIEKIPDIFRDMSKLWNKTGPKGNSGVGKRRREEAEIFERGLKCDCYK